MDFDVVSIGYPGAVHHDQPVSEPKNLGPGWVGFDYAAAFGWPVKVVNDAAMQALGSYKKDKLLFLGLGTGLGSTLIVDGVAVPMELAHLPFRKGTFEDYVGVRGLQRVGKRTGARCVRRGRAPHRSARARRRGDRWWQREAPGRKLPPGCRAAGDNANAFVVVIHGGPGMRRPHRSKGASRRR